MKRHVTIWTWLLLLMLAVFWISGMVIGYSLGEAKADPYQCSGYSGRYFSQSNCGGQQCTSFQIFGFWSTQCNDPYVAPPAEVPVP